MGTSNFARPQNASKYYVIGENVEEKYSECECGRHYEWEENYVGEVHSTCPICETDVEHKDEIRAIESWQWDDIQDNIETLLSELDGFSETSRQDYSRNYNSTFLGEISKGRSWGDAEFTVSILPIMTSAYYEGATLDFKIEVTTYGDTFDYNDTDIDDIVEDGFDEYYIELNRGLAARFKPYARQWIEDTITELSEQVEKVFDNCTQTKLKRVGGFSDGTSVYEAVN